MKKKLPPVQIIPLGDAAVIVQFGEIISPAIHAWVKAFAEKIAQHPFSGFVEMVPAYTTVTIHYNAWVVSQEGKYNPYDEVVGFIQHQLANLTPGHKNKPRPVEIPVCYGGDFGPDLDFVADHNHLTPAEVIALHAGGHYLVYMIGFAPGFPYLGGMSNKIATPRKKTPRTTIPAGSVGIAGTQTGIYPLSTPGGWQLIGRTPLALFNPDREPASLLQAGDLIKFVPITVARYAEIKQRENEY
ncbi:kinase A inhibitor [Adhaeribacter aerolatus]|uniref:Kinase A inhibitor n=1 Tax=Adhaeribacter aerolatus TaxID=670289 RepID=A0A512B4I5_9BACT|nr:5-oxoprolinase subunit PxpB [Adhaeribacter aerolatus]GEO06883.1 kinase A inhibitor [Adhaeribacter aerolatus]